jgi:hypothetical protein
LPRLLTGDRLRGIFAAQPPSECVPEVHGERIEIPAQGKELLITGSKRPCGLLQSVFDLLRACRPRGNGVQLAAELNLLAHRHSEAFERVIAGELSERGQITVHLEPRNDQPCPAVRQSKITQSVRDVVSSLARAADVRVHDVLITDEGLVVTLQKAFPGDRSLRGTHEEMSELERTLKPLIPDLARVHIDPEISNPD